MLSWIHGFCQAALPSFGAGEKHIQNGMGQRLVIESGKMSRGPRAEQEFGVIFFVTHDQSSNKHKHQTAAPSSSAAGGSSLASLASSKLVTRRCMNRCYRANDG